MQDHDTPDPWGAFKQDTGYVEEVQTQCNIQDLGRGKCTRKPSAKIKESSHDAPLRRRQKRQHNLTDVPDKFEIAEPTPTETTQNDIHVEQSQEDAYGVTYV